MPPVSHRPGTRCKSPLPQIDVIPQSSPSDCLANNRTVPGNAAVKVCHSVNVRGTATPVRTILSSHITTSGQSRIREDLSFGVPILALSRRHKLHHGLFPGTSPSSSWGGVYVCVGGWVEATKKPRQVPVPTTARLRQVTPSHSAASKETLGPRMYRRKQKKKSRAFSPESQGTPLIPSPLFPTRGPHHNVSRSVPGHPLAHPYDDKGSHVDMAAMCQVVKGPGGRGWGGGTAANSRRIRRGRKKGGRGVPANQHTLHDLQTSHHLEFQLVTEGQGGHIT